MDFFLLLGAINVIEVISACLNTFCFYSGSVFLLLEAKKEQKTRAQYK